MATTPASNSNNKITFDKPDTNDNFMSVIFFGLWLYPLLTKPISGFKILVDIRFIFL